MTTREENAVAYDIDWMKMRRALRTELTVRETTLAQASREMGLNPTSVTNWLKGGEHTGLAAQAFVCVVKWLGTGIDEFLVLPLKARAPKKPNKHALELTRILGDQIKPGEDALQAAARVLKEQANRGAQ